MSIIRWRCAAVERREMSRNTEFSIIIIACDVEPYIEQCIASVRRQTLPDFEAVVGIEASADGTGEAALRAVGGDVRFRIVDLPRSGSASCVRNYGIRHATGEYLFFLDWDDWLAPDALEQFHAALARYGQADLIQADAGLYWQDSPDGEPEFVERITDCRCVPEGVITGREAVLRGEFFGRFFMATWMRCCRREFLLSEQLFQPEGRRHQDVEWTPRVLFRVGRVIQLPRVVCCYRKRPDSVTTKPSLRSLYDEAENTAALLNFYCQGACGKEDKAEKLFRFWLSSFLMLFFIRRGYPFADRAGAIAIISGTPAMRSTWRRVCRDCGPARKLLMELACMGGRGGLFFRLADLLFICVYSPLILKLWPLLKKKK